MEVTIIVLALLFLGIAVQYCFSRFGKRRWVRLSPFAFVGFVFLLSILTVMRWISPPILSLGRSAEPIYDFTVAHIMLFVLPVFLFGLLIGHVIGKPQSIKDPETP